MEDTDIIDLYFARSEKAIEETSNKYGKYINTVSYRILRNESDVEECVNDTWLHAWKAIPPVRPEVLKAFLAKIARNISLHMYEKTHAQKRGSGEMAVSIEELTDAVPSTDNTRGIAEKQVLADVLNRFLEGLSEDNRVVFVKRYFYLLSVKEIAEDLGVGESKVKMQLLRSRNALKVMLEQEEIYV